MKPYCTPDNICTPRDFKFSFLSDKQQYSVRQNELSFFCYVSFYCNYKYNAQKLLPRKVFISEFAFLLNVALNISKVN